MDCDRGFSEGAGTLQAVDSDWITLTVVQPSARRREWELRQGDESRARLRIPPVRSGARAEAAGQPLRIERHGHLKADYVVRDETTNDVVASLRRDGRRRLLELGGRESEWRRLGRKEGFGFVSPDGTPFLRAKLRSGLDRTSVEVQIGAGVADREALIAALLSCYLLIRKNDEEAASVAATVAVVAS